MARLTVVLDIEDIDTTLMDPHDVAAEAIDFRYMADQGHKVTMVGASWPVSSPRPQANTGGPTADA
jgi:hypothetical protein